MQVLSFFFPFCMTEVKPIKEKGLNSSHKYLIEFVNVLLINQNELVKSLSKEDNLAISSTVSTFIILFICLLKKVSMQLIQEFFSSVVLSLRLLSEGIVTGKARLFVFVCALFQ